MTQKSSFFLSRKYDDAYIEKVRELFGSSLIAHWPGGEPSGTDAVCVNNAAMNGVYSGVTPGQAGIGDGRTCPLYDGVNDFTNVYRDALAAAFNPLEGMLAAWVRVSGAGVWTDGAQRIGIFLGVDGSNQVFFGRHTVNNQLRFTLKAGVATQNVIATSTAFTNFMHLAITWSKSADQVKSYQNGVQFGTTQTGIGTWAGSLTSTNCAIGAINTTPASVMDGNIAHAILLNRAATAAEIAAAYNARSA